MRLDEYMHDCKNNMDLTYYLISEEDQEHVLISGYKDLINGIYSALLNMCIVLKSFIVGNIVYLILDDNGGIATANECIHDSWMVI